MHVISFKETYLSNEYFEKIKKEFQGTIHYSPCLGKSGGLLTFFSNSRHRLIGGGGKIILMFYYNVFWRLRICCHTVTLL